MRFQGANMGLKWINMLDAVLNVFQVLYNDVICCFTVFRVTFGQVRHKIQLFLLFHCCYL